ncbi:hypothetical protein [Caballeronia telluris]|uniref:Uncharacterized protein n=1 Tax=Caballeronia telluris TaxID=326475 RepID=A0A158KCR2_9BURK|nr:hypothetical protein [Caballeronia telluris]SAL78916.1 hypothetical protein AWB66_05940 [Caballeronia telluris]
MTNQIDVHGRLNAPVSSLLMSTPPNPSAEDDSEDLDDVLDETGAVTNRSKGKSGTDTKAEPDLKGKVSAAPQPDQIEQRPVPGHTE